jgi:acyl CoA:acetate/3-ketoacid CoA transferase beta subunit
MPSRSSSGTTLDPRMVTAKRCARELRGGEVVNLGFGPKPNARDGDSDMTKGSNEPMTAGV